MAEIRVGFERELDTRLDEPWARVYPGNGGTFFVCPVCQAMVPDEVNIMESNGAGRIVGRKRGFTVQAHINWHKELGG